MSHVPLCANSVHVRLSNHDFRGLFIAKNAFIFRYELPHEKHRFSPLKKHYPT